MGWTTRRWRTWLGLVTLGLASFVLLGSFRFYAGFSEPVRQGVSYPRIQQAAGVIDLLRDTDPKLWPAVLRALDGVSLQASIESRAPSVPENLRRAPRVEAKLREFAAPDLDAGLRAYVNGAAPRRDSDTEGLPVLISWPTTDGKTLTLTFIEHGRAAFIAPPPGVWIGVAGILVATLAQFLSRWETGALRRVAALAETFDGAPTAPIVEQSTAPEMRRLASAVSDMQQRVAGLLQERSFLIGAISHDLKTYLTRVMLRAETMPDLEQRERMASDLETMTDLIETSLAFARGTTVSQHKTFVDLADLIAIEVAERIAAGQPVTLASDNTADAVVQGDPVALRRVLANLVDNALKFGQGRVEIALEADSLAYRILIDDDGPGVNATERAAIFSPFYRIEGSRNRRTGGSGLGLAIARQIVEAHGGAMTVSESGLGGARFGVSLPKTAPG